MPKLSSGRQVAVEPKSPRHVLSGDDKPKILWLIAALRLEIHSPKDLRLLCQVLYFDSEVSPTREHARRSGFSVHEVISGKAGWSPLEIQEFADWMDQDRALNAWLADEYSKIDSEIKSHPLWTSDFMLRD